MSNITDAIPVLRAARKVFELAGNTYLVACCDEFIQDVEDEHRRAVRQAKRDQAIRRAECSCGGYPHGFYTVSCAEERRAEGVH